MEKLCLPPLLPSGALIDSSLGVRTRMRSSRMCAGGIHDFDRSASPCEWPCPPMLMLLFVRLNGV
jgi:hypothetical protein